VIETSKSIKEEAKTRQNVEQSARRRGLMLTDGKRKNGGKGQNRMKEKPKLKGRDAGRRRSQERL